MNVAPSLPVAARVILLVLAVAAAVFALGHDAARPAAESAAVAYACPMHRQVTSASPGTCGICGMELVLLAPKASVPLPVVTETVGRRVLQHQPRVPAWVADDGRIQAFIYRDDLVLFGPGDEGLFHPAASPAKSAAVRLTDRPPVPRDASTAQVEFRNEALTGTPSPGTVGWIELPARSGPSLVVPSSAVLNAPEGPFLLTLGADGSTFARRPVTVGRTTFGVAVILSGVSESDRIVARGAFFLDAEQKLSAAEGR